ncbi:DNA repair protein RecO [Candidatus Saccharibacteria bacterium]|nr:DNA repair protein RecO [Candidatus Saccharibacteria bacterium]
MLEKNISDDAIVLSRVNFGEKDRILTVITPNHGKLKLVAKSVRSSGSKLAGGIELFSENHIVLVRGRSDMFTLISSKMKNFFGNNTPKDIKKSEYAYNSLKSVNKLTPDGAGGEYYSYLLENLKKINENDVDINQLKIWFSLKILKLTGSTPNLKTLKDGQPIPADEKYSFDYDNHCFFVDQNGNFTSDSIKILRYFDGRETFKPISNCPNDAISKCCVLTDRLESQQTA